MKIIRTNNISERPTQFKMSVQGGMLEALGLNMYSTLGKCLVEFIANAYDADSGRVEITIPFESIIAEREKVREAARQEVKEGKREPFSLLTLPLPENIEVVIRDDGHGMSPADIETKFLPFNRNRRKDDITRTETKLQSEGGKRQVMGRKGLGKLAGFGTSEVVVIRTKRNGYNYATEIKLDYAELKKKEDISDAPIAATYIENLPPEEKWTEIRLARLKCDAVKFGRDSLTSTLADNFFGIDPLDFEILLNGDRISQPMVNYEFFYPPEFKGEDLAEDCIEIDDFGPIDFKYIVKFRGRGDNLPASKRGARIYCIHRLAAGPSLFTLPTGMHGFHNISYMECIVKADKFDQLGVDLINTNRTQLKEDNEAVAKLVEKVVQNMKDAVAAHAKFRDEKAERDVEKTATGKMLMKVVDRMPAKTRKSARVILSRMSADYGAESDEFQEIAPLILDTMNAGEVLIRLIELGTDPKTIPEVAGLLRELADIEKSDALKLYRGRRDGISALTLLINRGNELWGKKGIENELHVLLKKAPWLICPEFGRYSTSNNDLESLYTRMAKELEIDVFALPEEESKSEENKKRPDLVFVLGPGHSPSEVIVVELKSPSIPLSIDHLLQLKLYMSRIDDWCIANLHRKISVKGFLIGQDAPPDSKAQGPYQLRKEKETAGPTTPWDIRSLEQLVESALKVHLEEIKTLEDELPEESALKAVMQKQA